MKVTAHMLVKNEEQWIWYAIQSVLPFVDKFIVFDTGSTDDTLKIISTIYDDKLTVYQKPISSRADLVTRRQEMVAMTKTEWFLLVDGDEVWPEDSITLLINQLNHLDPKIIGAIVGTRNCVGDVFHYQPESAGNYRLKGRVGHYTIRAYRKHANYAWKGVYPLEGYMDSQGNLLNQQAEKLMFVQTYYYHLTHLRRTNNIDAAGVIDRKGKYKLEIGKAILPEQVPWVFYWDRPSLVPSPWVSYTLAETFLAHLYTPLRNFKRYFQTRG